MARRTGGKGTSAGSGGRPVTGRYGRKYNLEKDDDDVGGGSYVDTSHCDNIIQLISDIREILSEIRNKI